jgi:GH15 family glucan-1,4-alpha-glucosidase
VGSSTKFYVDTSGGTVTGILTVTKSITSGVVTLTDAATITVDASQGNHFRVTLGGSRTLANPTNPVNGQKITFEFIQDATGSRVLTLDTQYSFGTDITSITLTTTASKRDFMSAIYNSTTTKWYVTSFIKGY